MNSEFKAEFWMNEKYRSEQTV